MAQTNQIIVVFAAVGAVAFLFIMDWYYRRQEKHAEENLARINESCQSQVYLEVGDEGNDEPNIAA